MYDEELKERNIYYFKPSGLRDTGSFNDYDDIEWECKKLEHVSVNKVGCHPVQFFMDIDSEAHRHIFFGHFSTFYIDLDKANISLFKVTEIPRKFVSKIKRDVKLNSILDEW